MISSIFFCCYYAIKSVMIGSCFSSDWGGDLESSFMSQSDVYSVYFDDATIDVLSPYWVASWYRCIFMSQLAHIKIGNSGSQWAEVFLWRGWSSRGSHSDDDLTISWRALVFQTQVLCKLKLKESVQKYTFGVLNPLISLSMYSLTLIWSPRFGVFDILFCSLLRSG